MKKTLLCGLFGLPFFLLSNEGLNLDDSGLKIFSLLVSIILSSFIRFNKGILRYNHLLAKTIVRSFFILPLYIFFFGTLSYTFQNYVSPNTMIDISKKNIEEKYSLNCKVIVQRKLSLCAKKGFDINSVKKIKLVELFNVKIISRKQKDGFFLIGQ